MRSTKSLVALLALALVAAAVAPAAVSAAPAIETNVEQNPDTGDAVVTVQQNGTAVEDASVEVTTDDTYSGTGNYSTDANGTVELPEPNETVSVNLTVTVDNQSSTITETLYPREESLDTDVEQADDGTATVTVTQYGDVVEDASVEVTADGNYSETGTYSTDANGTVELAEPAETQNVTVTATYDNLSAEVTAELVGANELSLAVEQSDDGAATVTVTRNDTGVANATVDVSADGNYSGTGTYQTGDNGTVDLPAPSENVTVTVTASSEGDEATTTTTLTTEFVDEQENFGQSVVRFLEALRGAGFDGPPGQIVSDFVTENNPGNADEAPGQAKQNAADDKKGGPSDEAKENKKSDDKKGGPSDEADRNDDDEDEEDDEDDEDDGDDDGEQGPPDHAKGN